MILPKEQLRWLVSQTDGIFSHREVHDTKFAARYLSPPVFTETSHQFLLAIRRDLTRNLGGMQKTVFDLLRLSLDTTIGRDDTSWHEINLVAMLTPAITSAIQRILVGQDLSADEGFLESVEKFQNYIGIGSIVIGQYVPYFLATLVEYLASIVVGPYRRKALRYIVPEVQARMDAIQLAKSDPAFDHKPPEDLIQWGIGTCKNASVRDISEAILSMVSSFILFVAH